MSLLCLVVDEGKPCAGPLRFRYLPDGSQVEILSPDALLPSTHTSDSGTDRETNQMAERTLEQQIEFIGDLAKRQFPDDEEGQLKYRLELVTQKLREYAAKVVRLEVRQM